MEYKMFVTDSLREINYNAFEKFSYNYDTPNKIS